MFYANIYAKHVTRW